MKRIFYLAFTLLLSSCLTEKNADPGKPSTFVRYFNGGNSDVAQVAEETTDKGIIILGTTEVKNDNLTTNKIKLIKTDEYGNVLWQNVYPSAFTTTAENITGRSLLQLTTGSFLVIGTITLPTKTAIHIIEVNADGILKNQKTIDFTPTTTFSVQGQAIQLNSNGNYLVLGSSNEANGNMILAELDKSDLSIKWAKKYEAGESSLSNKIFLDGFDNVYWSGTVTRGSLVDIRLVKTPQNSLVTEWDRDIGKTDFLEYGNDICRYGFGFAVIGNTNEKADGSSGDQDILFKVLTEGGAEVLSKSIEASTDTDNGNAIYSVRGGIVILGVTKVGGQDDYYLAKYDAFGNEVWNAPRIFGNSTRNDKGASVRQLSDGSLLILGTTDFGGVKTLMLMKADSEGNIE